MPVAAAAASAAIEAAVFGTETLPDSYRFRITTIDGRPVELTVRRVDDERVYEAEARVGRFDDDEQSAAKLLAAFDEAMVALGKKKRFESR